MADAIELDTNQKVDKATQAWVPPNALIEHTDAPDLSRFTGTGFVFGGVHAPGLSIDFGVNNSRSGRENYPVPSMVHLPVRD